MNQESEEQPSQERIQRIKISIELGELSSKKRKAILGLIKDLGFMPEEISEIAVEIPEPEGETGE